MRALATLLFASTIATSGAACVKTNAFKCDGDNSLCSGDQAMCEPDGFCSVASSRCSGGREYSDTAGDLAGKCIGGDPQPDGPPPGDGPQPDSPPTDTPQATCGAGYAAITDGNPNHLYMAVATPDRFSDQQNNACVTTGGYIAIPDDAAELAAIFLKGGNVEIWLGATDRVTEGTFIDVKGQPYTALAITNGNNEDCLSTANGTAPLGTTDCDGGGQQNLPTVCECDGP